MGPGGKGVPDRQTALGWFPRGRRHRNFSRAPRRHSATVLVTVPFSGSSTAFHDEPSQICKLLAQGAVVESSDRGLRGTATDLAAIRRISRLQ